MNVFVLSMFSQERCVMKVTYIDSEVMLEFINLLDAERRLALIFEC